MSTIKLEWACEPKSNILSPTAQQDICFSFAKTQGCRMVILRANAHSRRCQPDGTFVADQTHITGQFEKRNGSWESCHLYLAGSPLALDHFKWASEDGSSKTYEDPRDFKFMWRRVIWNVERDVKLVEPHCEAAAVRAEVRPTKDGRGWEYGARPKAGGRASEGGGEGGRERGREGGGASVVWSSTLEDSECADTLAQWRDRTSANSSRSRSQGDRRSSSASSSTPSPGPLLPTTRWSNGSGNLAASRSNWRSRSPTTTFATSADWRTRSASASFPPNAEPSVPPSTSRNWRARSADAASPPDAVSSVPPSAARNWRARSEPTASPPDMEPSVPPSAPPSTSRNWRARSADAAFPPNAESSVPPSAARNWRARSEPTASPPDVDSSVPAVPPSTSRNWRARSADASLPPDAEPSALISVPSSASCNWRARSAGSHWRSRSAPTIP